MCKTFLNYSLDSGPSCLCESDFNLTVKNKQIPVKEKLPNVMHKR